MAKELPSLGELEMRVLRLVWQQQPCTERQITDVVQQERLDWLAELRQKEQE